MYISEGLLECETVCFKTEVMLVANIQQVEAPTRGITSLPRPCSRSYAQSVGALLLYGSLSPTNLKLSLHRSCFFSKHFSFYQLS